MKLAERITANRWLITGLSVLPTCVMALALVCLFVLGKRATTVSTVIPAWMYYGAFSLLPMLLAIVGFVIACWLSGRSGWQLWPSTSPLSKIYTVFFVVIWDIVFGFLGLYVFLMGFGDGPEPTSFQAFGRQIVGILSVGFPLATLISLTVCSVATAMIVAFGEATGLGKNR